MGSVAAQLFSGLSRDFRSGSSPALDGPLKYIQRLVPKPLLRCLGCVLRVIVLLEGEPLPQSEVLSALEQVSVKSQYLQYVNKVCFLILNIFAKIQKLCFCFVIMGYCV
jgi:hypothetical protein